MAENETPEPVIVITLTLKPTPKGYQMNVASAPADVYQETVVEACNRASQFYRDKMIARETVQTLEQIRRVREQSQRIMHR